MNAPHLYVIFTLTDLLLSYILSVLSVISIGTLKAEKKRIEFVIFTGK